MVHMLNSSFIFIFLFFWFSPGHPAKVGDGETGVCPIGRPSQLVRGLPLGASCVKSVADGSMIRFLLLTTPLVIRGAATDYRMTNSVESCWTAAVYSNFIELVDAKKRQEPAKSVSGVNRCRG